MKQVIVLNSTYKKLTKAAPLNFDCNPRKFSEDSTCIDVPDKLYSAINVLMKLSDITVDEVIIMLLKKKEKDNDSNN